MIQGDCLTVLRDRFADESVQCCVTSPPYWGLRDYSACICRPHRVQHESSTLAGSQAGTPDMVGRAKPDCPLCNGTGVNQSVATSQLGLEQTPEEYVAKMVEVFREVRRVLKPDGTLWLNLGDSYSSGGRSSYDPDRVSQSSGLTNNAAGICRNTPSWAKPKDLLGIPWRVAFALQADGWYLRSDIIWAKPNPMPESVTDRPTKAHEYLFLMSKSERYYYDADAIAERAIEGTDLGILRGRSFAEGNHVSWHAPSIQKRQQNGVDSRSAGNGTRNRRSVWTIATQPYPDAHFATFPTKLIEPCILAGCPAGGLVLDPFAGSGTTLMVAKQLNRNGVGIELNPAYIEMAQQRLLQESLPL